MGNLSGKAQELLAFLREEYKKDGYMYSASWPYESLKERGFGKEAIHELQEAGLIQRRDCEDYAFELVPLERKRLIAEHSLCAAWYEKVGDAMLLEIQQEARHAAAIPVDKDSGMLTVPTMKSNREDGQPAQLEVSCAFSVGQVVNLEYDLPKKLRWVGYRETNFSGGVAVGPFMVTDVVHNLLVHPSMNLLEVQSLCEEFNKLYPQERTMMVFEDVLLKRTKELDVVFTHGGSLAPVEIIGAQHELSAEEKEKFNAGLNSDSFVVAPYSPLSVEELISNATVESRSLEASENENLKESVFEKE